MPILTFLDPRTIVIRRATRQRQLNLDIEDLKNSITVNGLIEPIVIRTVDGNPVLVAGERRLQAVLELGHDNVAAHNLEDMSDEDAEVIELEENIKRKELHWRDHVKSIGRIHVLYKTKNKDWIIDNTCRALSIHQTHLHKILRVFEALESPRIANADSIEQAYNTLQHFAERKAESIVSDIIANGAQVFGQATQELTRTATDDTTIFSYAASIAETNPPQTAVVESPRLPLPPLDPIICADFLTWVKTYTGPKFSLIHCDFPYGNYKGDDSKSSTVLAETDTFYDNHEEIYWNLLSGLVDNLDNLMSYSAHLIFWFNMNFYTETVMRLRKAGLFVHDHPLIWFKTPGGGGTGVVPGTAVTYPRRTYDTALLAVRGNRPLAKPGANGYVAPTVGNKIHPSQKPEPMLRQFLSLVVDETTTVLDPTCGSGAALRAAEDLGAKSILGLELDPTYAAAANAKTLQARVLRQAGMLVKSE